MGICVIGVISRLRNIDCSDSSGIENEVEAREAGGWGRVGSVGGGLHGK